jgi:tetratricopeptide (TPR) repeat protein
MEIEKQLVGCDSEDCDEASVTVRCPDCRVAYYCSERCRLNHASLHQPCCRRIAAKQWRCIETTEQEPLVGSKGAVISIPKKAFPGCSDDDEATTSQVCSICLDDPHLKTAPLVTLEACHHLFCLPCLVQWQRKSSEVSLGNFDFSSLNSRTLVCPSCRSLSDMPETSLLHKARDNCARGKHPGCPLELRTQFLNDAFMISSALLQVQEPELAPMLVLADVLLALNRPKDAFATTRRIMTIDKDRHAVIKGNPVLAWLKRGQDLYNAASYDEARRALQVASQLSLEQQESLTLVPMLSGQERAALYQSLYLLQCEAYQKLGKWADALRVYQLLLAAQHRVSLLPSDDTQMDGVSGQIWKGLATCHHEMKEYGACIGAANQSIDMDRSLAGVHRLKALSLVKQAEQSPDMAMTLWENAILTMNQGVLYEAPWDDQAQMDNQALYQSLQREFLTLATCGSQS